MSFSFASSYVALWIWAIFQGLLTLAVFRQVLELEKRSWKWQGMAGGESLVGTRAPKFSGVDFHTGRSIDLSVFDGQGGVILFLAASCSVCRHVAKGFQHSSAGNLPRIVAFCIGNEQEAAKLGKRLGPQVALLLGGAEDAASLYRISDYPTAVIVDGQGRIRAHSGISSAQDLQHLVARSTGFTVETEMAVAATAARQNA